MEFLRRLLRSLPLLVISPLLLLIVALTLAIRDLMPLPARRKSLGKPSNVAASVVIPNWNGKELLAKYIPTVIAATANHPGSEIIVVDNASSDGSAEFLAETFPSVKVLLQTKNLGFGGGSNAGFRAAMNDIVVLLNSDMRVAPDFLQPLLDGFADELVFAVSCQIFFSDPGKLREESGLTEGWWENGALRVRHRIDEKADRLFPCFYGGGGSCAFHRQKFLELGGFDELMAPFYLEDTDLGYQAWKRGWKVLYQPASVVFHEHRGTIGKTFRYEYIQAIVKRNFLLFVWKNIRSWRMLGSHFFFAWIGAVLSVVFGDAPERTNVFAIGRAFLKLPAALRSRGHGSNFIDDREAFRRAMPGYFHDRFSRLPAQVKRPSVLFLSPYPICPPTHGGGVFMYQTLLELVKHADVHLLVLLDAEWQRAAHQELAAVCASSEFFVRISGKPKGVGSITPYAVREFSNDDLRWAIHRSILRERIDAVQLEYTNMGQYAESFQRIACVLFEHDIYFQSIGRSLEKRGLAGKMTAGFEYLRALRYELRMLPRLDRIQMCSQANLEYLAGFAPELRTRMQAGLRAGIATARYEFTAAHREPDTLLFLGSFRHTPNSEAMMWFVEKVFPAIVERRPNVRLIIIGSDPPPRHALPTAGNIELVGFVDDVREALARYAVFICPILTGSGVRVKLLEAFAAGIPVVSTYIGAEGLSAADGEICALADEPLDFTAKTLALLDDPVRAGELALRARAEVAKNWDMETITRKLAESYCEVIAQKRATALQAPSEPSLNR